MKKSTIFIFLFIFMGIIIPLSGMVSSSSDSKGQKRTFEQSEDGYLENPLAQALTTTVSDSLSGSLTAPNPSTPQVKRTRGVKHVSFNDENLTDIRTFIKEKKNPSTTASVSSSSSSSAQTSSTAQSRYPTIQELINSVYHAITEDASSSLIQLLDTPYIENNRIHLLNINSIIPTTQGPTTLLEIATLLGKPKVVETLITLGAQVNKTADKNGVSPIIIATRANNLAVVQELLKEPTLAMKDVITAENIADENEYFAVGEALISHCNDNSSE